MDIKFKDLINYQKLFLDYLNKNYIFIYIENYKLIHLIKELVIEIIFL